jgi:outer membrane murein-binding lipoprotein Lpp
MRVRGIGLADQAFPAFAETAVQCHTGIQSGSGSFTEREGNMKIPTIVSVAVWTALASLVLAGCSTEPDYELKMAGIAMDNARSVNAKEYAPQDWKRAEMQWQVAEGLIDTGHYSEAKDVLIEATASYNDAHATAKRHVDSLKLEIEAIQTSAETELQNLEQDCKSPKIKSSVRMQIEAALPRLKEKVAAMKVSFDAKEYEKARTKGQDAVRDMVELQEILGIRK